MQRDDCKVGNVPHTNCRLCPRLYQFRVSNRENFPAWYNAPVPSFGGENAQLLVVGLAPGLKGANRTGRPFTADFAGRVLYRTLTKFGLASGHYDPEGVDDLALVRCRITNAVRCVPPKNRPTGIEITTCNQFLKSEVRSLKSLKVILALGAIAHGAVLNVFEEARSKSRFGHGVIHHFTGGIALVDSYHCSRLNVNTGRLNDEMFDAVFRSVTALLRQ